MNVVASVWWKFYAVIPSIRHSTDGSLNLILRVTARRSSTLVAWGALCGHKEFRVLCHLHDTSRLLQDTDRFGNNRSVIIVLYPE